MDTNELRMTLDASYVPLTIEVVKHKIYTKSVAQMVRQIRSLEKKVLELQEQRGAINCTKA